MAQSQTDADFNAAFFGTPSPSAPAQAPANDDAAFNAAFFGGEPAATPKGKAKASAPMSATDQKYREFNKQAFGMTSEGMAQIPFGKDAMGAVGGGLRYLAGDSPSFGSAYQSTVGDINAAQESYEQDHPGRAMLGGASGLIGLGGPAAGAIAEGAQGLSAAQRLYQGVKQGAKAGAVFGGLSGLGTAGGDVETRLENAKTGAEEGAGFGAILPPVFGGIGKVGGMVGRGVAGAASYLGQKAGLVAADHAGAAERMVMDRFAQDQISPSAAADQMSASGKPLAPIDVGGQNVQGLGRRLVTDTGPARQTVAKFLEDRTDEQSSRVIGDIRQHLSDNTNVYQSADNLLKSRSASSRPAYEAAEAIGPIHSERLQQFLDTPEVKAGLKRGMVLERQNAIAEDRPIKESDYAITGYRDGNWDEPIFGETPTMKSMIVANEGLGARIQDLTVNGRLTKDGLALKKFRDAFQGVLDKLSGGKYEAARKEWSGPSQSLESVQNGLEHFSSTDPIEQLKAEFDKLGPSDQDFYRIGAARALQNRVNSAPDAADVSKKVFGNQEVRDRIKAIFPEGSFEKFAKAATTERVMADTDRFVRSGSQSANKVAEMQDHPGAQVAQEAVTGFLAGGPKAAVAVPVMGAVRRKIASLFPHLDPNIAEHVAQILTQTGEAGASRLRSIEQNAMAQQAKKSANQAKLRAGTGGFNRLITAGAVNGALSNRNESP